MKIKIINMTDFPLPKYARPGDSGLDLRAAAGVTILPHSWAIIPTGIKIELEKGYEAQVRPRSGLAAVNGVFAVFGTIDNGYRGEIMVILVNPTQDPVFIERGKKIAQLVPVKIEYAELEEVEELSPTERGENGLGSTGDM